MFNWVLHTRLYFTVTIQTCVYFPTEGKLRNEAVYVKLETIKRMNLRCS